MTLSEAMKLSKVMPVCRTSQSATQGSKRSLSSPGPAPCRTSGCRSSLAVLHAPPLDVPGLPPAAGLWTRWGPSGTRFLQMSSRSLPQLLQSRLTERPSPTRCIKYQHAHLTLGLPRPAPFSFLELHRTSLRCTCAFWGACVCAYTHSTYIRVCMCD